MDKIYNKLIINILQYGKSGLKVGDKQVENRPGKDGNAPQNAGIKAGLFRLQKATCKPPYGCTCRPSKKISHSPRPAGLLSGSQPAPTPKDAKRQHTSAHPAGLRKESRSTQTPAPIMSHAGQSGKTRSDPIPPKSDPVISGSHLFPAKSHRMRPVSDRKPHIPSAITPRPGLPATRHCPASVKRTEEPSCLPARGSVGFYPRHNAAASCLQLMDGLFLEIAVEQAFESATVASLVTCHFVYGVVDSVEVVLLSQTGDAGFVLASTAFSHHAFL